MAKDRRVFFYSFVDATDEADIVIRLGESGPQQVNTEV